MKSHPFNDMFKDFAESVNRLEDPPLESCPENKKRQGKSCNSVGKWCRDRCPIDSTQGGKE